MKLDTHELKREFENAVLSNITRAGINDLLDYLSSTDFYKAPASTKFHMACEGGLVFHSLAVFKNLKLLCEARKYNFPMETIALVSLFHDICKTNYYIEDSRNVKNKQTGAWEAVPYYNIEDAFPLGHGEKSVFIIHRYVKLSNNEALAIRWHMSGWDSSSRGGELAINFAYDKCELCSLLACADLMATYLDEVRE